MLLRKSRLFKSARPMILRKSRKIALTKKNLRRTSRKTQTKRWLRSRSSSRRKRPMLSQNSLRQLSLPTLMNKKLQREETLLLRGLNTVYFACLFVCFYLINWCGCQPKTEQGKAEQKWPSYWLSVIRYQLAARGYLL